MYSAQNPTMHKSREIGNILLNLYLKGEVSKIYIIYTEFLSGKGSNPATFRLLPFHRAQFEQNPDEKPLNCSFEFEPGISALLDNIVPGYVSGYIYSALVNSFCSEQNARMSAMEQADKNAEKILSSLKVQYNRIRQSGITQEITEISSGAKSLRNKKHGGATGE